MKKKCCYKKQSVIPKDSVISAEAEYNALRAEKIFRYEYSNQLNTTLLTVTLAVFSAGILWFSIDEDNSKILEFAKFFFPLFFLLPCFFARICFRCSLRNSMRISVLSEYMRTHLKFQNDNSWEYLKKRKNINYFYDSKNKGIGGVKEMPMCVTFFSIILSSALGKYSIIELSYTNIFMFLLLLLPLVIIYFTAIMLQIKTDRKVDLVLALTLFGALLSVYELLSWYYIEDWAFLVKHFIYDATLLITVLYIPQYRKEIDDANQQLECYHRELEA